MVSTSAHIELQKRRILIIRPSSIGDIIMALPMLRPLRKAYPDAYIAWLVDSGAIGLLRFNSELDEAIPWDKARWKLLWKKWHLLSLIHEVILFSRTIRSRHFDLALDAQGLLRSRILAWLSGARERVGFKSSEPGRFLMTRIISKGPNNKRMGSEYCYMIKVLGIPPSPFTIDFVFSHGDLLQGEKVIKKTGIHDRYTVICPFTTRPQKHWVESRWARLGVDIQEKLGLPVVILGGPADVSKGEHIRSLTHDKIVNIAGMTTIGQSAAIIKKACLVIGVDTGLTHMGITFNRPTIALFGPTCPYLETKNKNAVVLYEKMVCSPCRRKPICNNDFTCMKSIAIEQVFKVAQNLVKQEKKL